MKKRFTSVLAVLALTLQLCSATGLAADRPTGNTNGKIPDEYIKNSVSEMAGGAGVVLEIEDKGNNYFDLNAYAYNFKGTIYLLNLKYDPTVMGMVAGADGAFLENTSSNGDKRKSVEGFKYVNADLGEETDLFSATDGGMKYSGRDWDTEEGWVQILTVVGVDTGNMPYYPDIFDGNYFKANSEGNGLGMLKLHFKLKDGKTLNDVTTDALCPSPANYVIGCPTGAKVGDGSTSTTDVVFLNFAAGTSSNKTDAPAFAGTSVAKTAGTQSSVNFALTAEPAAGTTYSVYSNAAGTTASSGYSAAFSGKTLTLSHATDVAAGDYYITATTSPKTESNTTKVTVTDRPAGNTNGKIPDEYIKNSVSEMTGEAGVVLEIEDKGNNYFDLNAYAYNFKGTIYLLNLKYDPTVIGMVAGTDGGFLESASSSADKRKSVEGFKYVNTDLGVETDLFSATDGGMKYSGREWDSEAGWVQILTVVGVDTGNMPYYPNIFDGNYFKANSEGNGLGMLKLHFKLKDGKTLNDVTTDALYPSPANYVIGCPTGAKVGDGSTSTTDVVFLNFATGIPTDKTDAPVFDSASVAKTAGTQSAVNFALTTEPAAGTTYSVYSNAEGTTASSGYSATFSGKTLTLSHATDVAAGDYFITATTAPKVQSNTTKVTVSAYVTPDVPSGGGSSSVSSYLVKYDMGKNGTTKDALSESVSSGKFPKSVPTVVANKGFTFLGWSLDGKTIVKPTEQKITKSTTFTALYKETVETLAFDKTLVEPYIKGIEENGQLVFKPEAPMTRGEVAVMLVRTLNLKMDSTKDYAAGKFADLKGDEWYAQAVGYLAELGVMKGSQGLCNADKNITRAEFVALVMRIDGVVSGENTFADVNSDAYGWAVDSIISATAKGYIDGDGSGNFLPGADITRASVVKIMNGILGRTDKTTGEMLFTDVAVDHWAYNDIIKASTGK